MAFNMLSLFYFFAILYAFPLRRHGDVLFMCVRDPGLRTVRGEISMPGDKLAVDIKAGANSVLFMPIVDGGSGEAWLPNTDNWVSHSQSFKNLSLTFSISYANSKAQGYYVKDTLKFGDVSVQLQFGLVDNLDGLGTNSVGVLGLAKKRGDYDTLPYALKAQDKIKKATASIYYLDSANSGQLIFGGYDKGKVDSTWASFDSPGFHWEVPVLSMKISDQEVTGDSAIKFVADTGAEISYFPKVYLDKLIEAFQAENQNNGYWKINCDQPSDKHFQILLDGITIDVPYNHFVWHAGGDTCFLGAGTLDLFGVTLFGNNVLRNVYTQFDYESLQVKLAKIRDTLDEDIVPSD